MKLHHIVLAVLAGLSGQAMAAVSADEAKQLGTTLTEFGAIKAGNADGTIPPYTGGLTAPPPGYKAGSSNYIDPFKDEKPLFRIDAKNMDKYADKLTESQKALMKRDADYYIDVYPSHRTVAYPDKMLKATVRNATSATCKTLKEGLALDPGCRGGLPFPIPKNGQEAMWNHQLRYLGDKTLVTTGSRSWVVDTSGRPVMTALQKTVSEYPYYQTDLADRDPDMFSRLYSVTLGPARKAGEMTGLIDFLDPTVKPRRAWQYTPGQRRVKLAPEFAYDTPVASQGGVTLFDEIQVFSGKMDRFDFKLLGKKELYIPYNGYKVTFDCPADTMGLLPKHANPACERWELHRVWIIEATLKPGQRHVYSRRVYYFDEDMTGAGIYEAFDQSKQLYRSIWQTSTQLYDVMTPWANKVVIYDFNKGMYAYTNDPMGGVVKVITPFSEREQNPEAVTGREGAR